MINRFDKLNHMIHKASTIPKRVLILISEKAKSAIDFLWEEGFEKYLPLFLYRFLQKLFRGAKRIYFRPFEKQLALFINNYPGSLTTIIFPPSLDWYTQLFQRPQQLALSLARQGALVLYIQPKFTKNSPPFKLLEDHLILCNLPVEAFWKLKNPIIYILTWNRKYIRSFDTPFIIYDYVDEIETFYGNHAKMYRDHQKLISGADLVLVTAKRLLNQVRPLRADALSCPNGVDYALFAEARNRAPDKCPADIQPILAKGNPIVGYYGAMARWFNYRLMIEVAYKRPDLSFVLIGPDYDFSLAPSGILEMNNIHWLGVKPYSEIPLYLSYFDVATIPFDINTITHSTSPLKLFEYMAGGKPVVITPMEESMRYPGVLVAKNAPEFCKKIDEGLHLKNSHEYLELLDQVARQNTWDERAKQILGAILNKEKPL